MSFGGKLAAIDKRSGTRIWQREIDGSQTPWTAGNMLYVLSSDNQLICLNKNDGSIFWISELQRFKNEKSKKDLIHWTAPIMAQGRLILASSHGRLLEVNAHNGDIIRTTKLKGSVNLPPVVAGNTLYLLLDSGTLIAYR